MMGNTIINRILGLIRRGEVDTPEKALLAEDELLDPTFKRDLTWEILFLIEGERRDLRLGTFALAAES